MKNAYTINWKIAILLIVSFIQLSGEAYASHAQGGDLTYTCLGNNQYRLRLAFYRDCAGVNAPANVNINISSVSCNQNFSTTLYPIAGTGQDVTPICPSLTTECAGGMYPGVQEWIFEGNIILPQACTDWIFSFTLCCRNAAINTINNPGGQNIYIETTLNNVAAVCNNSPTFSNRPVPFICAGQNYCFNHGALDIDGDSLAYALVDPLSGPGAPVAFIAPYTAVNPLPSVPAVTLNPVTGDICMNPSQIIVAVMAVRVEEWRNGVLIGTIVRDIQVRTVNCNNNLPSTTGINNTNTYSIAGCAGALIQFNIFSNDPDAGQIITMTWNNGIAGGTFNTTGGPLPTGNFSWIPTQADISNTPWCFTVTVSDDACPYAGSQTYAFCITVTGFNVGVTTTATNCGSSNGTATALATGGTGPYSFNWQPSGGNNANANGLTAGTYTVYVTDAGGCASNAVAVVTSGPANSNINATFNNINCFGGTEDIFLNVNGGQQPYTYQWSNNANTANLLGISAGTYSVIVTTASGCTNTATYTVTQPATALSAISTVIGDVTCAQGANGSASTTPSGGTGPYNYSWNSTPAQTAATATGLTAGNYSVVISDANGCTTTQNILITEPPAITSTINVSDVTCYGGANGSTAISVNGGVGPYSVSWSSNPVQSGLSAINLSSGNISATIIDANGCVAVNTVNIAQPPALNTIMTGWTPVSCFGGSNGTANVQSSGGTAPYTYSWNTMPAQTNANATNMIAGMFTVTVTDANGCATIGTVTITEPTPVLVTVSPGDTICPNQAFMLAAYGSGGTGSYSYNWSPNLGNASSYTVYAAAPTTWTVSAVDANGCTSAPLTIAADVFQFSPANLSVSSSPSICAGASAQIFTSVNGNTGQLTWNWSINVFGPGPHTVYPTQTTTYSVNVTNVCGVVVPATTQVTVHPIPVVTIDPQFASGCDAINLSFADTSASNAGCTYFWDFGDNSTGTGANTNHDYAMGGNYTVAVTVTSPFGCSGTNSNQVTLIIYDSPLANFVSSSAVETIVEPTFAFSNLCSGNTLGWLWDFGDTTTSTLASPTHTYARTGIYNVRLIAESFGGCMDTVEHLVEVTPEFTIFIPTAFTPNGDGINEAFYVYATEINTFNMQMFDRWGNLIFESDNLYEGWDGRANGGSEIAQQDVYVYKVFIKDFEGKQHKYTGSVTLLK
jgi:gliding motility-associated-like protein